MGSAIMKRFCFMFIVLLLVGAPSIVLGQEMRPDEAIVAMVNGSAITRTDYDTEMKNVEGRLFMEGKPLQHSQLPEIGRQVLENLIDREILYQESQKIGVKISETAINREMATLKKRFPSEDEFRKMLGNFNLSEEFLRSQIEKRIATQGFIEKQFVPNVRVSQKEIRTFYDNNLDRFRQPEQVRVQHILLRLDPKAGDSIKASTLEKMENIKGKIQRGEDFSILAKEFSQCPSSADGGDLGSFCRGQMVKSFEDAAFALKVGEVSPVVETPFGCHLIKLVERKPEATSRYEEVIERIEEHLKSIEINRQVALYLERIRGEAQIERILEEYFCPISHSNDSCISCH